MSMLGRTQILRIPFVVACLFLQVNSGGCDAPTHIEPIEAPLPTTKGLPHTPQQGPWLSTKIRRDFDRNVGFKSAGSTFTEVFEICNHGPRTIIISSTPKKSVEAIEVTVSKTTLEPRECGKLVVTIQAPLADGFQRVMVNLGVEDPANVTDGRFVISFKSRLPWKASTNRFNFAGRPGEPVEVEFWVIGQDAERELLIDKVTSDLPGGTLDLERDLIQDGSRRHVKCQFTLPDRAGTSDFQIVVQSSDTEIPDILIPITCNVLPPMEIAPREALVILKGVENVQREFSVRAKSAFRITQGSCSTKGIEVVSDDSMVAKEHSVVVTIDSSEFTKGFHRAVVEIVTEGETGSRDAQIPILITK